MIPLSAVKIDLTRDKLFDELGMRRLRDSYMRSDEQSPQERFRFVACSFASSEAHAQRLYDYLSQHWLSASTPILSFGVSKKALPISCYLSYVPDSSEGLVEALAEICWLSMSGGGVGIGLGMRSEDAKSVGTLPHQKVYEAVAAAFRQGKTRRGSFATWLDISHPNIMQHIELRKSTGDANLRCPELHHGVNIPDAFMEIIEKNMLDEDADDDWPLYDKHDGNIREIASARYLWEQILLTRVRTGEPMMHFIDASNRALPVFQKDLGLHVAQSNICTEITLATNDERTAVCCLASPNLEYWELWKDNYQFYYDIADMLDNALTMFIKHAPAFMRRAVYSASRERSIGIGALGFHALLQSKMIPFESALATSLNYQIFSRYKKYFDRVNYEMAKERGECPDAIGYQRRFSHMTSIAPNASSSIIMGNTSPSIEPYRNNGYRQDTLSGSGGTFNKFLARLLRPRCANDEAFEQVKNSIITNAGSVMHLDILNDYEKDVFKTASEIDQLWVVQHAVDRQQFIDQAQSVNIFIKPDISIGKLHHIHYRAWKGGLKTLYYLRSDKLYHGESMNKQIERVKFDFEQVVKDDECLACQ